MKEMFKGATSFNQPIENWDALNVVDMRGMLYDAKSFKQKIPNWNISYNYNATEILNIVRMNLSEIASTLKNGS